MAKYTIEAVALTTMTTFTAVLDYGGDDTNSEKHAYT
jgi:hypothetical protein